MGNQARPVFDALPKNLRVEAKLCICAMFGVMNRLTSRD